MDTGWLLVPKKQEGTLQKMIKRLRDRKQRFFTQSFPEFFLLYVPMDKFSRDHVFGEKDGAFYLLDGLVFNWEDLQLSKGELEQEEEAEHTYLGACASLSRQDPQFFRPLEGTFNGLVRHADGSYEIFTDQLGERTVYFVPEGPGGAWLGSNYNLLMEALHESDYEFQLDEEQFRSMVVFGGFFTGASWDRGVLRLMPGEYVHWDQGQAKRSAYHQFDFSIEDPEPSREEWIERLDREFRKNYRRELEKNREYGYLPLLDVSGGLDSRMVTMVAKDLGYDEAYTLTYGASGSYEMQVVEKLIKKVKYPLLFSSLDDGSFLRDVEEMTRANFGSSYYIGITGGKRLLESLNQKKFGIEHTGLMGNMGSGGYMGEETRFAYKVNRHIREGAGYQVARDSYPDLETFYFTTRGFLWGLSSMITRRQYTESYSPFMVPRFLNLANSIPEKYREEGKIFIDWMAKKYPEAMDIVYATTMAKPNAGSLDRWIRYKYYYRWEGLKRKVFPGHFARKGSTDPRTMNPLDNWYRRDRESREYLGEIVQRGLTYLEKRPGLKDIRDYFASSQPSYMEIAAFVTAVVSYEMYILGKKSL